MGKTPKRPEPLISQSQPTLPDQTRLELCVVARPMPDAGEKEDAHEKRRDVYLSEVGTGDGEGARSAFLRNTNCPLPTVRRIMLWAERLAIPIRFDPPANMEPGFKWPDEKPPEAPVAAKSDLD